MASARLVSSRNLLRDLNLQPAGRDLKTVQRGADPVNQAGIPELAGERLMETY